MHRPGTRVASHYLIALPYLPVKSAFGPDPPASFGYSRQNDVRTTPCHTVRGQAVRQVLNNDRARRWHEVGIESGRTHGPAAVGHLEGT
jgi:hypothetical protein